MDKAEGSCEKFNEMGLLKAYILLLSSLIGPDEMHYNYTYCNITCIFHIIFIGIVIMNGY